MKRLRKKQRSIWKKESLTGFKWSNNHWTQRGLKSQQERNLSQQDKLFASTPTWHRIKLSWALKSNRQLTLAMATRALATIRTLCSVECILCRRMIQVFKIVGILWIAEANRVPTFTTLFQTQANLTSTCIKAICLTNRANTRRSRKLITHTDKSQGTQP